MGRVRYLEQRIGEEGEGEGSLAGAAEVEITSHRILITRAGEINDMAMVASNAQVEVRGG